MSFILAIRLTEILLGLAFLQQSFEHIRAPKGERLIFIPRIFLSLLLVAGFQTQWVCIALFVLAVIMLQKFQGPYNGGSDRMGLLILTCLCAIHLLPAPQWQELAFGYLAIQLILSYFIAGWVKVRNPEWRTGQALQDVFTFSAYPVSQSVRAWANHPRLLRVMSWSVIMFELAFPLALLTQTTLIIGLSIATLFHLANAVLFGLNRFLWIWIAAYPSLWWLQNHVFH